MIDWLILWKVDPDFKSKIVFIGDLFSVDLSYARWNLVTQSAYSIENEKLNTSRYNPITIGCITDGWLYDTRGLFYLKRLAKPTSGLGHG